MTLRSLLIVLLVVSLMLMGLGLSMGSAGWMDIYRVWSSPLDHRIMVEIRAPRVFGAWLVGALLALAGAVAQGLFRNPLAEPYLLGSSSGAGLAVATWVSHAGSLALGSYWGGLLGQTGAAFVGSLAGVLLALFLANGATHSLRLLLAGVVVGVVLGAVTQLLMVMSADAWRTMQSFMLGSTAMLGWWACVTMGVIWVISLVLALLLSRVMDALTLGEDTARSLGVPLGGARAVLVGVLALATAAAVAQAGLVAFVGLVSPHLIRRLGQFRYAGLLLLSSLAGGVLLLAADILGRSLFAPTELPVGVLTAVLGGSYLLWLMHRRPLA
ncbi:FecCD family ABC transporter permease [Aquabacterium sp.]|uniref:FecCD family ABC transporter permease n=1 Tax=Aquabacterium sp. TaxID=1872578 RepID=UPI0035B29541